MTKRIVFLLSLALFVGIGSSENLGRAASKAGIDDVANGRKLFQRYCASCHGVDAKGDGPVAGTLKVPPPDLTKIKMEDGKFPAERLRNVISGENGIPVHGKRNMPVWGATLGRSNIDALVKFLETLQNEPEIALGGPATHR